MYPCPVWISTRSHQQKFKRKKYEEKRNLCVGKCAQHIENRVAHGASDASRGIKRQSVARVLGLDRDGPLGPKKTREPTHERSRPLGKQIEPVCGRNRTLKIAKRDWFVASYVRIPRFLVRCCRFLVGCAMCSLTSSSCCWTFRRKNQIRRTDTNRPVFTLPKNVSVAGLVGLTSVGFVSLPSTVTRLGTRRIERNTVFDEDKAGTEWTYVEPTPPGPNPANRSRAESKHDHVVGLVACVNKWSPSIRTEVPPSEATRWRKDRLGLR